VKSHGCEKCEGCRNGQACLNYIPCPASRGGGYLDFAGTRPLQRVEVVTKNGLTRKHTMNVAEIQDNGVPVSGHIYVSDAECDANEKALRHGLDHYFVDGERVAAGSKRWVKSQ
jgi:hypothetical protein